MVNSFEFSYEEGDTTLSWKGIIQGEEYSANIGISETLRPTPKGVIDLIHLAADHMDRTITRADKLHYDKIHDNTR